jgi:putative salt-induced outer membrane protein YdiY
LPRVVPRLRRESRPSAAPASRILAGLLLLCLSQTAFSQQPAGSSPAVIGPQSPAGPAALGQLPWRADPLVAPSPANPVPPVAPPAAPSAALPAASSPAPPPPSATVAPKPPPKIWEGGLELGLNGSEGNSQNFNLHFGAKVKRKTELTTLSSELDYKKNNADSVETANKAFLDSRFEYLFQNSPWTWFVHNIEDYDEFKAYDLRVSLDTGLGYQLVKNDLTSLVGRLGGGTTREIGGPDDQFIPEIVFGLEGEHKLSKRQKLCASVEYRPDVTEFSNYRMNAKAAWEVLLDEERHLSMKVGVLDRYDSNADGHKPNDLDYTLTLLWSF